GIVRARHYQHGTGAPDLGVDLPEPFVEDFRLVRVDELEIHPAPVATGGVDAHSLRRALLRAARHQPQAPAVLHVVVRLDDGADERPIGFVVAERRAAGEGEPNAPRILDAAGDVDEDLPDLAADRARESTLRGDRV